MANLMEVTCRCGWSIRGSEADVISGIQAHARVDHDVLLTPADVRARWRVVEEDSPPGQSGRA